MSSTPRFRALDWDIAFPLEALQATDRRLRGNHWKRRQVSSGIRGSAHRWQSMIDHGARLADSFGRPMEARLDRLEEADLFGLFVNAVATLECLGYAAFGLGSIRRRAAFPFEEEPDRRPVTLGHTARKFRDQYPRHDLTMALQGAAFGRTYAQLRDARNHMSHRAAIPRMVTITQSSRTLSWSLAVGRGDDVELTVAYIENIQRLTAAHAFRLACGLDAFTRESFVPVT